MDTTLMNLSELHRMNCPSSSATAKAPTPPFFEGAATCAEGYKVKKASTKTTFLMTKVSTVHFASSAPVPHLLHTLGQMPERVAKHYCATSPWTTNKEDIYLYGRARTACFASKLTQIIQ